MRTVGASSPLIRSADELLLIPSLSADEYAYPFPELPWVKTRHVTPSIKRSEQTAYYRSSS